MALEIDIPLSSQNRRQRIFDLLAAKGAVRVAELSVAFQVSEVTVRNDLEVMERQGRLIRDRGGAIARTATIDSTLFGQRAQESQEQKQRIARAAASLLSPGETVMMDSGSTLMQMAKHVQASEGLTVITNALNIAITLMESPQTHVIVAGGSISRETISTIGVLAERDINDFRVDKLFLGTHAFNAEDGLLDLSTEVARVKLAMISAARHVILLADSSKWGRSGFAKVAPLSSIDMLVSDTDLPEAARSAFSHLDIAVTLV